MTVETTTAILSCPLRSWTSFEIEIGGLLVLDETSLLKTVLVKADPVLLYKNLNSCSEKKKHKMSYCCVDSFLTYLDEKVKIEISASSVLLVRVLYSSSFDESNTL